MIENFNPSKILKRKQWAYRALFLQDGEMGQAAKIVLADLIRHSSLNSEIVPKDPVQAYGAEMARLPVRRILRFLNIDVTETYNIEEEGDPYE